MLDDSIIMVKVSGRIRVNGGIDQSPQKWCALVSGGVVPEGAYRVGDSYFCI